MPMCLRAAVVAAVLLVTSGFVWAQDKSEADPAEVRALLTLADEAAAGQAATGIPVTWQGHHFIKSHGDRTYVPFTVAIDPGAFTGPASLSAYLRVAKRGEAAPAPAAAPPSEKKDDKKKEDAAAPARTEYPFEDVFSVDLPAPAAGGAAPVVRRAFAVPPGDYDVFIVVKERGAAAPAGGTASAPAVRAGVVKQEMTVPSLDGQLTTSSIILADTVEELQSPLPPERQSEQPYTFGQMRIIPSADQTFPKSADLNVIFWIYGAQSDPSTKKPDVEVQYNFHQKLPDGGEKFFNRTEPTVMNAQTLPAQFDLAAGHQLPGSLAVPLASFPEGDFRLEVKVTDKISGTSLTRDVPFTVTAQ